jgi:hypothetical protein
MSFVEGCACHVWAIDGYVDDQQAGKVHRLYENYTNNLLATGTPLGNRDNRIRDIVQNCRLGRDLIGHEYEAIIYGKWQNNTDSAPEHMWLVWKGWIIDTMPGAWLRRKPTLGMKQRHLHPPSEAQTSPPAMVGRWRFNLTVAQHTVIKQARWSTRWSISGQEYLPQAQPIPGWQFGFPA